MFNEQRKTYYYSGPLKKGILLSEEPFEDSQAYVADKYTVRNYEGKPYLVRLTEEEQFISAQFKNGEYQYIFKSAGQVIIRDESGNRVYPDDYFHKGMEVMNKHTRVEGIIETMAEKVALVKSFDGQHFNSKVGSLEPLMKSSAWMDILYAAEKEFEEIKPEIMSGIRVENTAILKKGLQDMLSTVQKYNAAGKQIDPNVNPTPKLSLLDKVKNKFKPTAPPAPPVTPTATPPPAQTPNLNISNPSHIGSNYNILPKGEIPPTLGKEVHKLTHVDLNPNSTGADDKFLYHYEVGDHRDKIASPHLLNNAYKSDDAENFPAFDKNENHPHLNGIYVPGERVKHEGKEYNVVSHIAHYPGNGANNYNKMLVKDDMGNTTAIPRNEARLISSDYSNSKKVKLKNGQTKFQHQLAPGDEFTHEGQNHKIIDKHTTNGYVSQNTDTGKLHFTSPKDFDKDYLSTKKPYRAGVGDMVKLPNGTFTLTHVGGEEKGKSVISTKDKDGNIRHFKIDSDKLNSSVVKQSKPAPLTEEDLAKYGMQEIPSPESVINEGEQPQINTNPLAQGPDPEKIREQRYNFANDKITQNLGEDSKKEHSKTHHSFDLGIGKASLHHKLENGVVSKEVQNGRFQFGKDKEGNSQYDYHITDYDPDTNKVKFKNFSGTKKKPLTDEALAKIKPETMDLKAFKDHIADVEKTSAKGLKVNTEREENISHNEVAEPIKDIVAKHFKEKGINNPTREQIETDSELHDKLKPTLEKLEDNLHKIKSQGSVLKKDKKKITPAEQFAKIEKHGDPFEQQVSDKIQNSEREQQKKRNATKSELAHTMANYYKESMPDAERFKKDIKNPSIHGDDTVAENHLKTLKDFEDNSGDYDELHKLVSGKVQDNVNKRYTKIDNALNEHPEIDSPEEMKKFLDENEDQFGHGAHDFFSKEDNRRVEGEKQEKIKNRAQREEDFKNYESILGKYTREAIDKHHAVEDKLDMPEIEGHLQSLKEQEESLKSNKSPGNRSLVNKKAKEITKKLSGLGVDAHFENGQAYLKNSDGSNGAIILKKDEKPKRGEEFNLDTYPVEEKHSKPLSAEEHQNYLHALDEFTGPDEITGKKVANSIKLADTDKIIPDQVFNKGIKDLRKNDNSKEAQIVREHIDKIEKEGVRANPTGKGYFTPEEIKEKLDYRRSGEHGIDKKINEIKNEFHEKTHEEWEQPKNIDDYHESGQLEDILGADRVKEYEELLHKKSKFSKDDNEIPFGKSFTIKCKCGEQWNSMAKSYNSLYICGNCRRELKKSVIEYKIEIASIAVICGDEILMGLRRDNNKWGLPGGHLEWGEEPLEAALRELREETGLDMPNLEPLGEAEEISREGLKLIIHPFVCRLHKKYPTTMTKDPDEEVKKWLWKKIPLDKEILDNLHAPKNVTLQRLKLQVWN